MGSELGKTVDTKPQVRLNGLGIFWLTFGVAWTLILLGGIAFLWIRRNMPILRVRGLPLSIGAVLLMHVYWVCVTTGYVYGPVMPEVAEYWIMGLWLPFGVALFHASNSRFLYVADAQRKFSKHNAEPYRIYTRRPGRLSLRESIKMWWIQLDYSNKTLMVVSAGMAFQAFMTIFIYLISRKFHSDFGIPGTEVTGTPMEIAVQQGRGWEWWPTCFWQLGWAWIVAPIILFRSRKIADTQGWRFQTIACCIAGLPAAPMWLIALYVPAMAPVNNYFIPPSWIAVSIMFLEIFTIFVPIYEVVKQRNLTSETLESIARWESRQRLGATKGVKSLHSDISGTTWNSRTSRATSVGTSSGGSILTMDALEHTLDKNPEPLQEFSALKDFSGENIAFLLRVRDWRAAHFAVAKKEIGEEEKNTPIIAITRECFEGALHIYLDFISVTNAEFQLNLASGDFAKLKDIFEEAAQAVCTATVASDPATPFANETPRLAAEILNYTGEIPFEFNEHVFDDAELSIKYLVLTNTWPKYIRQRRSFDASSVDTV